MLRAIRDTRTTRITMLVPVGIATMVLVGAIWATPSGRTGRIRTVYGLGPEVHLLPDFGRLGTRFRIYGLGYRPGERVGVYVAGLGAEFLRTPLVQIRVGRRGAFRVRLRVSCRMASVAYAARRSRSGPCKQRYRIDRDKVVIVGAFNHRGPDHSGADAAGLTILP